MQYKIPQNVQIEDKIVGPLTLKQLAITGIGGGMAYAIYVTLGANYSIAIWLPPVAFISILTVSIAFLKIGGIPFTRWTLLMAEFLYNPRKRTFILGAGDNYQATLFAKKKKKEETTDASASKLEKDKDRIKNLGEITKLLDNYQAPPSTL